MKDINEVIKAAFAEADKELALNELGESEHIFSRKFEKKLKRKAALYFRNGKYVGESGRFRSLLARRAVAVACALVLLVGIAFNAEAIGDFIARWVVDPGSESTHISFDVPEGVEVPETIEERYVLSQIPEGYDQVNDSVSPRVVRGDYEDAEGNTRRFAQASYSGFHATLDTENAEFKELQINGCKGYCLIKGTSVNLIWENGRYCFALRSSSELKLEELITMAETIEKNADNNK